jgi:hypothetical protein
MVKNVIFRQVPVVSPLPMQLCTGTKIKFFINEYVESNAAINLTKMVTAIAIVEKSMATSK